MTNQPGNQPIDLTAWLHDHPATQNLDKESLNSLTQTMYEELELWIGTQLTLGLTDEQVGEFAALTNTGNARLDWLTANIPDYIKATHNLFTGFFTQPTAVLTQLADTEADPATWGLQLTLHVSEHLGLEENQARIHNSLGILHREAGRWNQALDESTQALNLYTHLKEPEGQADTHTNLGNLHQDTGHWNQALDSYTRALQLYTQLELTKEQARVHNNLGNLHRAAGHWNQAHDEFTQALQLYTQLELTKEQARVHNNLGTLHRAAGRWNQALDSYTRALNLYTYLERPKNQAMLHNNLGNLHKTAGRWNQALDSYTQALELYTQLELIEGQATVHNNLGNLHQSAGRWNQALDSHTRALQLYTQLDLLEGQANVHDLLSSLAVAQSQPDAALNHFNTAVSLYQAQGLPQEAAWAAVARARGLRSSKTGTTAETLTLALPAALYLDTVRFQFRTAPERLAWASKAASATTLVLELAAETNDPQMVADLVETNINNTTHTTGAKTLNADNDEASVVSARALGIEATEAATTGSIIRENRSTRYSNIVCFK